MTPADLSEFDVFYRADPLDQESLAFNSDLLNFFTFEYDTSLTGVWNFVLAGCILNDDNDKTPECSDGTPFTIYVQDPCLEEEYSIDASVNPFNNRD